MDTRFFQSYICPQCGSGVVKFFGWGQSIHMDYYRVFECDNSKCDFQQWKPISFRDLPSDIPEDRMFLAISNEELSK
jgi:hypothetical protein